jgi:serine/threonine-protein kinase RsbW
MMTGNGMEQAEERLILRGRLSELAQVSPWIERLASQYAIPGNVHFAIDLCLEEVLSNIVLHGYGSEVAYYLIVRFTVPREGYFVFVVDDEAPRFNPLDQPELPALNPREEMWTGGQGLRMLQRFADVVEYEPLRTGNRLRMSFSAAGPAARAE